MSATTPRTEQSRSWSQRRSVAPPSSATRGASGAASSEHTITARQAGPSAASGSNPYAGHRQLRQREQEVLGEYAKLAATIKRVETLSADIASSERHAAMLRDLRILERKMGLVLTLFKASVWSLIQTHQDEQEQGQDYEEHDGRLDDSFDRQQDDEQEQTLRAEDEAAPMQHASGTATGRAAYRASTARTPPTRYSHMRGA